MRNTTRLGPWIRRFLLEHLVNERNLARNTQRSYRDTLALLVPFVSDHTRVPVDRLDVDDLSADRVRQFLQVKRSPTREAAPQRLAINDSPRFGPSLGSSATAVRSTSSGRATSATSRSGNARRHR